MICVRKRDSREGRLYLEEGTSDPGRNIDQRVRALWNQFELCGRTRDSRGGAEALVKLQAF